VQKYAERSPLLDFSLLILLGILWGVPYALTKIALATIPPLTMVAVRVSLAAIILWIVVFARKRKLPSKRGVLARLFLQGCLSCVLPYTLLAFGQQSVDSALAAILNSTTPLFVCFISLVWTRHETLSFSRLLGVSLGLAGVVLIVGSGSLSSLGHSPLGEIMIVLATAASAMSAIHGRSFVEVPPEITAAGTLTAASVVLVPLSILVEQPLHTLPSLDSVIALLVNGVVATAFGFVVYFELIRTIGSTGTASVGYLKLGVGALVGYTFMGEVLTWTAAAGFAAIFLGVAAINQPPRLPRLWTRIVFPVTRKL
jgi:drug/metabolite transporter (DMT)-like permease